MSGLGVTFHSIVDVREALSQRAGLRKGCRSTLFSRVDSIRSVVLQERREGAVQAYNDIIRHETLRVAVCEVMEQERSLPKQLRFTPFSSSLRHRRERTNHFFRKIAQKQFLQFYPDYVATCEENRKLDGTTMTVRRTSRERTETLFVFPFRPGSVWQRARLVLLCVDLGPIRESEVKF